LQDLIPITLTCWRYSSTDDVFTSIDYTYERAKT